MWSAKSLCLLVSLLITNYKAASVEELRQEPQDVSRSLKRLDAGTPDLQALTTTGVGPLGARWAVCIVAKLGLHA